MQKHSTHYVKTIFLFILLLLESSLLSVFLMEMIRNQNILFPSIESFTFVCILIIMIYIAQVLTIGAWEKWEHYLLVPIPVTLGITAGLINSGFKWWFVITILSLLLLAESVYLTDRFKKLLLKFHPRLIFRNINRTTGFVFAILAGIYTYQNYVDLNSALLKTRVSEFVDQQYGDIAKPLIEQQLKELQGAQNLREDINLINEQYGFDLSPFLNSTTPTDTDNQIKANLVTQIMGWIEPYKQFIPPALSIITFAFFQFLFGISYFLFTLLIDGLIIGAKKINFLHVEEIEVKQEILKF
ncbi:hypothetical protein A3F07_02215 [candidate division WWE3 bacterium RIFCSPHIGHO2_12_FULL_38_15]|uniref:Uncharacterized protein n=1 Tax=candidate division WWE3 bacterium RIFCSPHIGHO2_02_FULL_38_14 TaxID=1802620 RepID=A0A1F4V8F3_UNCKA|nr:MAG: hypothetical protein A2793_03450 [candidate division WWE3 bacterium RIFCSPHIGHO2_01_FULL_38_45]OGC48693.1 MAG: hypothetical protein A3F07_02215 [candidate division WWE3 bacterium RIFCSPHIGHO2_12_FULL_38_15]OGC53099.1 MAG: hypothetical protein A3B64_01475 [candidate division WWE3 bacterium RIFCSPLOWO2_01_FULL_37_24]OGC53462.1 MAG: hypothetical protein A3D91_00330 [candidate division WWE3 bacterium RIFCSPHIGHO2_02_FULL_38_14]HLB51937.1 hypothetical protein [Patescibacteria group bacterium